MASGGDDGSGVGHRGGLFLGGGIGLSIAGLVSFLQYVQTVPTEEEIADIRNNAAIALEVVKQHGDEFVAVRNAQAELRAELTSRLELSTQDRFYAREWRIHDRRLKERLKEIERRLDRCEAR